MVDKSRKRKQSENEIAEIKVPKQEIKEDLNLSTGDNLNDTTIIKKKKKKKKERSAENDLNQNTLSSNVEAEEAPTKKKKKRKQKESDVLVESDNILPASDAQQHHADDESSADKKRKRKKKKRKSDDHNMSEILNVGEMEQSSVETTEKKKKKKEKEIKQEETSFCSVADDEETLEIVSVKKKKKKKKKDHDMMEIGHLTQEHISEINDVVYDTPVKVETTTKLKDVVESSSIVIEPNNNETHADGVIRKKKKKKRKEGSYLEETNQTVVQPAGTVEVGEETEKKKKKKKKKERVFVEEKPATVDNDTEVLEVREEIPGENVTAPPPVTEILETENDSDDVIEVSLFMKAYSQPIVEKDRLFMNWKTTETDLKNAGIRYAHGKWSKKEMEILEKNINRFKMEHSIPNFRKFYISLRDKTAEHVPETMYEEIGENILRTFQKIRFKLEHMFMPVEHEDSEEATKTFSLTEIEELIKLQKIFGSNWNLISRKMNRPVKQLQKKWSDLRPQMNRESGENSARLVHTKKPFTSDEDAKLKEAVALYGRVIGNDTIITNWNKIAEHIGTNRTGKSCQQRWSIYHSNGFDGKKKNRKDTRMLFVETARIIQREKIEDMNEVNWKDVVKTLKSDVPEHYLRKVFWNHLEHEYSSKKSENFLQAIDNVVKRYS